MLQIDPAVAANNIERRLDNQLIIDQCHTLHRSLKPDRPERKCFSVQIGKLHVEVTLFIQVVEGSLQGGVDVRRGLKLAVPGAEIELASQAVQYFFRISPLCYVTIQRITAV